MDKVRMQEILKERKRILKDCQDNWYDGICWCSQETIKVAKEDLRGFIEYIKNDCTTQDYLFITDWFDDFIQKIPSQELVDAFRETYTNKYSEENKKYRIDNDLDEAIKFYGNGKLH